MRKIIFTVLLAFFTLTMSAQLAKLTPQKGAGSTNPGSVENPYLISSVKDLAFLRTAVNSGTSPLNQPTRGQFFEMVNDIDVSASNWATIGSNVNTAFKGSFDGKGFKIIGLHAGSSDARVNAGIWGFFGRADTATIKNVSFTNVSCYLDGAGFTNIGGIVGTCYGTNILNCTINGTMDVTIPEGRNGNICLGSIAAVIYKGSNVINCSSDMVLNAKSFTVNNGQGVYVGGLVAFENDATVNSIVNCAAFGSISGVQTNTTPVPNGNPLYLGGILGYNTQGGNNAQFKIINCLAANTIYGEAASTAPFLLASGIGNSNGKPSSGVNVSNCIAMCPSLQLKADSVAGCNYYGVKRAWRVINILPQNAATATNLQDNYAKGDMQLKTGVSLITQKVSDNLFQGKSLGTTDYVALLNNYIASNPTYAGVALKNWTNESSPKADNIKKRKSN